MGKQPVLTSKDLVRRLEQHGFELDRSKGSHHIYINRENGKLAVVPMHKGDLPRGTLASILKQAGLPSE